LTNSRWRIKIRLLNVTLNVSAPELHVSARNFHFDRVQKSLNFEVLEQIRDHIWIQDHNFKFAMIKLQFFGMDLPTHVVSFANKPVGCFKFRISVPPVKKSIVDYFSLQEMAFNFQFRLKKFFFFLIIIFPLIYLQLCN
jgi:hypothetical protein